MPDKDMIQKQSSGKKHTKFWLVLLNIALMLIAVLFTVLYSGEVHASQERLKRENFCNTVETMKQISARYLEGEYTTAENWASYIRKEHMSMEEAMDYIRSVSGQEDSEAHFVDMDTFDAWSTNYTDGSNTMRVYRSYVTSDDARLRGYVVRLREMFDGGKYIFGKYKIPETQRDVISVGMAVPLREADGGYRSYLLLRVVPVERMKELWLFPVSFASAEIGLIAQNGDYVIPSYAMKSENFLEFVRGYNFQDDYNGADAFLAQLKTQDKGLMKLKDSRGRDCYWYYSKPGGVRRTGYSGLYSGGGSGIRYGYGVYCDCGVRRADSFGADRWSVHPEHQPPAPGDGGCCQKSQQRQNPVPFHHVPRYPYPPQRGAGYDRAGPEPY